MDVIRSTRQRTVQDQSGGVKGGSADCQTVRGGDVAVAAFPATPRMRGVGLRQQLNAVGLLTGIVSILGGCATTGSTLGSGVGDRIVGAPPYYAGASTLRSDGRIAHLPIVYQSGATEAEIFEPDASAKGAVEMLLGDLNRTLDRIRGAAPLDLPISSAAVPPDVMFGCDSRGSFECEFADDAGSRGTSLPMRLAVGRPSPEWVGEVSASLDHRREDHVLVVTLEIGEYWPNQTNWQGAKEVRLGTGYSQKVPWLTSLESPVQVVQLTGALVDREGRAVRIGAEGLMAKRTSILLSAFGAETIVTNEDIEELATLRRDDLGSSPLAWEVALSNLVCQLTGEGLMR